MVCTEVKNDVLLLSTRHCCRVWNVCQVAVHLGASHVIFGTLNFIQPWVEDKDSSIRSFSISSSYPFQFSKEWLGCLFLLKKWQQDCVSLLNQPPSVVIDWLLFSPPDFVWAHSGSDLPCCVCDLRHLCEWIQWQDLYHLGPEPADVHKPASCPWGKPLFCCHQQFNSKIFIYHLSSDVSMNISW